MAIYNLNMADERLIDSVLEPEQLVERVSRFSTFFEGVREAGDWMEANSGRSSDGKTGFTECKNMQRIATIPYSVAAAVSQVDPGFWNDKTKVHKFLQRHPEYDTRRTVR